MFFANLWSKNRYWLHGPFTCIKSAPNMHKPTKNCCFRAVLAASMKSHATLNDWVNCMQPFISYLQDLFRPYGVFRLQLVAVIWDQPTFLVSVSFCCVICISWLKQPLVSYTRELAEAFIKRMCLRFRESDLIRRQWTFVRILNKWHRKLQAGLSRLRFTRNP